MISYVENINNVIEYNELLEKMGLERENEIIIKQALNKTLFTISAYDYGEIVGYGRIIGDETLYIYIEDLMVVEDYRNQKIGTTIMYKLLDKVEEYKKLSPNIKVYVKGDSKFFKKFGFKSKKEMNIEEHLILANTVKDSKLFNWEEEIDEKELEEVIETLDNDGLIIFPTDTVYGIACNSLSERAIQKVFEIKNRARYKPINVLTDSVDKMLQVVETINPIERELIKKYMPGALTIIFNKNNNTPDILTAGLDTIGIRIPNNEIALRILSSFPYPLAVTSANISGEKDGVELNDFISKFDGKVDIIIDGGKTQLQKPSTIVRVENDNIEVIREGDIKIEL